MDTDVSGAHAILQHHVPDRTRHQAISQIASDFHYVRSDARIEDLSDDVTGDPSINAVGVVDDNGKITGIVVKNDFLSMLSRPYGRDVLRNLPVSDIVTQVPSFRHETNLFSVADEVEEFLRSSTISYFLLDDEDERFRGVFSTHDLLLHLSTMTQTDIELARKLQARIVRERDLVVGKTFEFTSYSSTAKGVGGDFYAINNYAEDRWFVTVCDVSGKGVSASIVTSVISGMMSIYDFSQGMRPFVSALNDYIARTFESEKFVTGIFATYNEHTRDLLVTDMGHSHIFLYRRGRLLRVATNQSNLPLGVVPGTAPKVSRLKPEENDLLLVITDGLLEQENRDGEVYSLERVAALIEQEAERPVEVINDRLIADFEAFRGSHHLNDDVTYGIMKFTHQDIIL